jgi:hypothetical protein
MLQERSANISVTAHLKSIKTLHQWPEGFSHPEIIAFKEKLKMSAEATPVDKAFIIPAIGSGIAKKYLHDTFEKFRFVVNNIIGNDKMVRVYKRQTGSKVN